MTPLQALELAIFNEKRFQEFFILQVNKGVNEDVRLIANEFLIQEKQLTVQMCSWKEQLENSQTEQSEDFDPPNIPE